MNSKKILVIGPTWLGDMVMAQSLFKSLKITNPNVLIDVAAPAWSFPLLQRMPEVHKGIELDFKHGQLSLTKRYQVAKILQQNNYSQCIVLPNSWKSALIPWLAKIPIRTGWCGEMRFGLLNDLRFLNKSIYPLMVERYAALSYPKDWVLSSIPLPQLTIDQQNIDRLKLKFSINNNSPILALCLGAAFGEAKCWPEEYYLNLASMWIKQNHHINNSWQILILGTKQDILIKDDPLKVLNLSGKTSLLDAIDLLSLADIVVCNDSGLMHIAAGCNKKIIAIYGATSPNFTPPLASNIKIINKNLPCSPCFARTCPLQHHNCMRQITIKEIFEQIQMMYNTTASNSGKK